MPPQGSDHAGKVAAAIPQGYILRASQHATSNAGDDVRWKDELVTEQKGRTRVTLDDGSILSVGSNSHMTVVQHDAASQQTQLELAVGKMRVQAAKLTKPGASFTVKTPTAVAGVVGTDFYVETDGKSTRVTVLEGIVKLAPAAAAAAVVSIAAGETSVAAGSAASAPAAASPSQISSATSSTSVSGAGTAAGASAASAATIPTAAVVAAAVVPAAVIAAVVPSTDQKSTASPSAP